MSAATIIVISIIVFIFNITISLGNLTEAVIAEINKKVDLVVEIKNNADPVLLDSLLRDMRHMEEVENVEFISKEKAFEQFKDNHPEKAAFLEKYDLNPLPAQIQISTKSPLFHEKIISFLSEKRFRNVTDTQKLKRKVTFLGILAEGVDENEVIEKIKESENVIDIKVVSDHHRQAVLEKTFTENKAEMEKILDLDEFIGLSILEIETEYPGKSLKAKEFLTSSAFRNEIIFVKELTQSDANKKKSITERVSEWIISLTDFVKSMQVWILSIVSLCGFVIIASAVQLSISMRREEIEIMKLVGASFSFIRMPFILEGAIYGILSSFLSVFVFMALLSILSLEGSQEILFLSSSDLKKSLLLGNFVIWEFVVIILFASFSAWIATLKHLRFSRHK